MKALKNSSHKEYILATSDAAIVRLRLLNEIFGPATQEFLMTGITGDHGRDTPRARAIRESQKVFVNLVEDGDHGLLDNRVFHSHDPQWTFAVRLLTGSTVSSMTAVDTLPAATSPLFWRKLATNVCLRQPA